MHLLDRVRLVVVTCGKILKIRRDIFNESKKKLEEVKKEIIYDVRISDEDIERRYMERLPYIRLEQKAKIRMQLAEVLQQFKKKWITP